VAAGGLGGSTAGELVSLLLGHLADVESVALDPHPEPSDAGLRGTSKKEFIDPLVGEPFAPHPR